MPQVSINFLAVLAGAVASMVIGYLWYGPLFGKVWISLMGMKMEDMTDAKKKGMAKSYFVMFIGRLVMAYALAYTMVVTGDYLGRGGVLMGLESAFWGWFGFIVPVSLTSVLFEGKSWKLWFINNGYQFFALLATGVVLGIWR